MPYAVTHILVPILLVAIFRDFYLKRKDKKEFPLHYVLIAGIGGVLPDIDLVISVFLKIFGVQNWYVHKMFTHSLFFPAILLVLFFIFTPLHKKAKLCNIGRHNLKLSIIFLMISFGVITHICLDTLVSNEVPLLYPLLVKLFGLNILHSLSTGLQDIALPLLDGILLVIWIVYLELKHKISDFI